MSIVENFGCVFFLYFPKISINDLQIQKFCPKKNFALWIELSTELNQNRSFQARNIWQSKYDQNSCNCTSNETHAAPKKAPLWTPLGAAFVHKLPNFLAFPFLRRIVDDFMVRYPTLQEDLHAWILSALLKCVLLVII